MNYLKTALLLGLLAGLFIIAGYSVAGPEGAAMGLILAFIMNFFAYWGSDKIVLRMFKAQQISPDSGLYHTVQELAMKAQMPMPKVYVMNDPAPNAFATGRNPEHGAVVFSTGLLDMMSKEELQGVAAHELSHIKHRDILISTIAATIAGAISFIANMAMWVGMTGGHRNNGNNSNPFVMILVMLLAPVAAAIIQMSVSRSREYEADRGGAEICGNPLYLANALQKLGNYKQAPRADFNQATAHMFIVNPLKGGSVANLFSTHPPLEERIKRLQSMNKIGI